MDVDNGAKYYLFVGKWCSFDLTLLILNTWKIMYT